MHYNNLKVPNDFPYNHPFLNNIIGDRIVSANFSNDVSNDNN